MARSSPNTDISAGKMALSPRRLAAEVLIEREGALKYPPPLNHAVEDTIDKNRALAEKDRALLRELVFGITRNLTFLDWQIDALLASKNLPLWVRMQLRIGAYQIIFLKKVPAFAAVDQAVEAVKSSRYGWAKGLVNAVLRRLSEKWPHKSDGAQIHLEQIKNPAKRLAAETSHPVWIVKRWIERYGAGRANALCRWNNQRAPLAIRVNTIRATRDEVIARLNTAGINARPGLYASSAVVLADYTGNPAKLPGWEEGLFRIQDEGAQMISLLLDPRPGETILDTCAGLGGKTMHLAELMGDKGAIHAFDTHRGRLLTLEGEARRLGLSSIKPASSLEMDCTVANQAGYDRILVDAPCSGLGVIRRRPDIKWNRTAKDIESLGLTQFDILSKVSPLLKPNGRLVYATCTQEPEETAVVIQLFLERNPGWKTTPAGPILSGDALDFVDKDGFVTIKPKPDGPDLFFCAILSAPC